MLEQYSAQEKVPVNCKIEVETSAEWLRQLCFSILAQQLLVVCERAKSVVLCLTSATLDVKNIKHIVVCNFWLVSSAKCKMLFIVCELCYE